MFSIPVGSLLRRILPIRGGLFKWGMSMGARGQHRALGFHSIPRCIPRRKEHPFNAAALAGVIAASLGSISWVLGRKLNATLELEGVLAQTDSSYTLWFHLALGSSQSQASKIRPDETSPSAPEPRSAPTIIMVVADTLRADVMSLWGRLDQ